MEENDSAERKRAWDAAAGRLLLAEFARIATRSDLVVWARQGEGDEERFEAALDTGAGPRVSESARPHEINHHDFWKDSEKVNGVMG